MWPNIMGAMKTFYSLQNTIFSTNEWYHVCHIKPSCSQKSVPFLSTWWCHMIPKNAQNQVCCKVWPLREWVSLRKCRKDLRYLSIECISGSYTYLIWISSISQFPKVPLPMYCWKRLLTASRPRNTWYVAARYMWNSNSLLATGNMLVSIIWN